jgi:hypothetical protein
MSREDLLWLDRQDLTARPLCERREALERLELRGWWQLTPRLDLPLGPELEAICDEIGLEGAFPTVRCVSRASCLSEVTSPS